MIRKKALATKVSSFFTAGLSKISFLNFFFGFFFAALLFNFEQRWSKPQPLLNMVGNFFQPFSTFLTQQFWRNASRRRERDGKFQITMLKCSQKKYVLAGSLAWKMCLPNRLLKELFCKKNARGLKWRKIFVTQYDCYWLSFVDVQNCFKMIKCKSKRRHTKSNSKMKPSWYY